MTSMRRRRGGEVALLINASIIAHHTVLPPSTIGSRVSVGCTSKPWSDNLRGGEEQKRISAASSSPLQRARVPRERTPCRFSSRPVSHHPVPSLRTGFRPRRAGRKPSSSVIAFFHPVEPSSRPANASLQSLRSHGQDHHPRGRVFDTIDNVKAKIQDKEGEFPSAEDMRDVRSTSQSTAT